MRPGALLVGPALIVSLARAASGASPQEPAISPPEVAAAIDAIHADLDADRLDEAVAAARRLVARDPDDTNAQYWAGRAYCMKGIASSIFTRLGWGRRCHNALDRAVELDPGNAEARWALVLFHVYAPAIAGGRLAEARRQADALLRIAPARGHIALGAIADLREHDEARAEREFREAATDDDGQRRGALALTRFLVEHERFDDARTFWRARLVAQPDDRLARFELAAVDAASGQDLDRAMAVLEEWLTVSPRPGEPTWAEAEWRLAQAWERLGRRDEAIACLHRALAFLPSYRPAKDELKKVDRG